MWGQLRVIQGGHLKIRRDWEKFKYEGAHKISWGFEKIEGARLSRGLLQRGVYHDMLSYPSSNERILSYNQLGLGFRAHFQIGSAMFGQYR